MPHMEARARRVGEHVEDVELGQSFGRRLAVPYSERMSRGRHFAWIPGAKRLLLVPVALPLGFDQMKRILPAPGSHNEWETVNTRLRQVKPAPFCGETANLR